MKSNFPPGHPQAILAGCKCQAIDNGHGSGAYFDEQGNPVFWFDFDCPIHGGAEQIAPEMMLWPTVGYTKV